MRYFYMYLHETQREIYQDMAEKPYESFRLLNKYLNGIVMPQTLYVTSVSYVNCVFRKC